MNPEPFQWPRLVWLDAVSVALILLGVALGVKLPLPIAMLPVFACLLGGFALLAVAKR